jgi:hypothetical protein
MKFRHDVLRALPAIMLACSLLSAPAEAQFIQQGPKLVGTGAIGNAAQALSVSLSADGNTAIVGGPEDDGGTGAAWVFTRSGGVWTQQAKLSGSDAPPTFDAEQGFSVSLSADGNTAILGGNDPVGAAWVFTRSGGVWSQQGPPLRGTGAVGGAQQGLSVSLSSDGNTAVIGGPRDDSDTGAAWIFTRSGGVWTQQGPKLVGTGAVGAEQGWSVSLSGDGTTAILGGPFDDTDTGAAWVFTRSGAVWTQQGPKLVGTGAVGNSFQGHSVSLSADGNTAIVGGPFDDQTSVGGPSDSSIAGAAWVFTRSSGYGPSRARNWSAPAP